MKSKVNGNADAITPVRIHLELKGEYLTEDQKRMLRRYGESSTGESISRDILIPSDMPLHNLHYAIQKLFGWQNSHLRCFRLPEEVYQKLTGGTVKGWTDLVGVLFQPPSESEDDIFWDDDYEKGSFTTWLKKKYKGPYRYGGVLEHPETARKDVQELLEYYKVVEVKESFNDYMERKKQNKNIGIRVLRTAPLSELTLDEMNASIFLEGGSENLLERLEVNKVIAARDEEIDPEELFPVTKELIYNYDFGDNWEIFITKEMDCRDLLESGLVSLEEIDYANKTVLNEHRPVCIHKDGVFLLDDVGGLNGFADFLKTIYESEIKEERDDFRAWARSLGWSDKRIAAKKIL